MSRTALLRVTSGTDDRRVRVRVVSKDGDYANALKVVQLMEPLTVGDYLVTATECLEFDVPEATHA